MKNSLLEASCAGTQLYQFALINSLLQTKANTFLQTVIILLPMPRSTNKETILPAMNLPSHREKSDFQALLIETK